MKFLLSIILIALFSYAACLYLPWYLIAIVAFLVNIFIGQKALLAWLSGFVAIFALWFGLSYFISVGNEHVLAHKISVLILKIDNPILLIFITGLLGGLVAGFAALAGSLWRSVFIKNA